MKYDIVCCCSAKMGQRDNNCHVKCRVSSINENLACYLRQTDKGDPFDALGRKSFLFFFFSFFQRLEKAEK